MLEQFDRRFQRAAASMASSPVYEVPGTAVQSLPTDVNKISMVHEQAWSSGIPRVQYSTTTIDTVQVEERQGWSWKSDLRARLAVNFSRRDFRAHLAVALPGRRPDKYLCM